ncbi:hypothetical protein SAM23877_5071 [Streptomyces ambofaciens ATCC 23877]|uniref:Uncharacterized protein n=2 Tax=Streptomyces ambofaciens TaxID=1889 RepID=A0A0K2AYY6_STRA7|nr:hypothetical protein [Streptomyces ambofaciens]AKZ58116.1 hypothetical protein SAM23877_5071 [Streptomyces ambofaciens ATCC 23877]ANB08529.1 hypothetical protein SAM40697_4571 [Streptomyces ambofaciens]
MKSEETPFEGGPMDGRVLPVLVGVTGHPPKTYRIPVPDPHGGPPTVLVYRRVPRDARGGLRFARWKYAYDPEGAASSGRRWPWSRPKAGAGTDPDATPGGKPDDAHG